MPANFKRKQDKAAPRTCICLRRSSSKRSKRWKVSRKVPYTLGLRFGAGDDVADGRERRGDHTRPGVCKQLDQTLDESLLGDHGLDLSGVAVVCEVRHDPGRVRHHRLVAVVEEPRNGWDADPDRLKVRSGLVEQRVVKQRPAAADGPEGRGAVLEEDTRVGRRDHEGADALPQLERQRWDAR